MTLIMFMQLMLGALTYMVFHWGFFCYASDSLEQPRLSFQKLSITYFINFGLFMVVTRLMLHLSINWTLIYMFLFLEVWALYHHGFFNTALLALDGAAVGLGVNIFTRCITAIVLNRPLSHFDNKMDFAVNIKIYPVSIAFVLSGVIFVWVMRKKRPKQRKIIDQNPSGMKFLLGIKSILYLFLLLNLLAYYTKGNSLSIKLWGLKSAMFAFMGSDAAYYYVYRISQIRLFQQKIQEDREELLRQKVQSEQIEYLAFTDILTNCYNRAFVKEVFARIEETDQEILLCFLDLDHLKHINDIYGHIEGDHYLRLAVQLMKESLLSEKDYIFRYGGDEFLILFLENEMEEAVRQMQWLQKELAGKSNTQDYPYEMSISYGIARRGEGKNLLEVLKIADGRMYEEKRSHGRNEG